MYDNHVLLYTDGSKSEYALGCAALLGKYSLKEHLPSVCSIYTAELRAILLACNLINQSRSPA